MEFMQKKHTSTPYRDYIRVRSVTFFLGKLQWTWNWTISLLDPEKFFGKIQKTGLIWGVGPK